MGRRGLSTLTEEKEWVERARSGGCRGVVDYFGLLIWSWFFWFSDCLAHWLLALGDEEEEKKEKRERVWGCLVV